MNAKPIFRILFAILLIAGLLSISSTASALKGATRPLAQSTLPQITFLGQGPRTFTVEPPLKFLVKTYQNGQFLFVEDDGPTYTAAANERVWTTDFIPGDSIRLFDEERNYGSVTAGCIVNYVQIEDNVDTRRNTFYINGEVLQVVEQGMVTYGSFVIPEDGVLTFYAEDSIGMVIELCRTSETAEPSATPPAITPPAETVEPSETPVAETPPVETATPGGPSETVTATPPAVELTLTTTSAAPTETVEQTPPSATATTQPTATRPAPTRTPAAAQFTATPTTRPTNPAPVIVVTATQPPPAVVITATQPAPVIVITATPLGTPGTLPVTGGVPGPNEIAALGAAILGMAAALAAGWVFLLRALRRG